MSFEEKERRALLEKRWSNYKRRQHLADVQLLDRLVFAQQQALDELRNESEELYQEAMQVFLVFLQMFGFEKSIFRSILNCYPTKAWDR